MNKREYLLVLPFLLFSLLLSAQASLEKEQWFVKARPCWVSNAQVEQNITVSLHAVVDLTQFSTARFRIAAVSSYKLYLNGEFLGYGPSIAAHGFFRVDEYNVKTKLKKGRNILAIEVAGYNVDNYYIPNQPSFVQAELVVDDKPIAATLIGNKKDAFKMGTLEQRVQDVPKLSFQRPFMESYKLDNKYDLWKNSDSFLVERREVEETEMKSLLPRHVKYPDYAIRSANAISADSLFGFTTNSTGFIQCKVIVKKPTKLKLYWDEILVNGDIEKGRLGYNTFIEYALQPGDYALESFEPYTLKFLKAVVDEGECEVKQVSIRQYVNSDESTAIFKSSDTALNKIFEAAVETHKQSALDVFMDCPSRERAGWLCDSYFSARVASDFSGNTLIEHNFFENYALPKKFNYIPDGMLPMCYPSDHSNGVFIPNWAMWFVLQLDEYMARSNDQKMLQDLKPKVLKLLAYFDQFKNEDGLLEKLDKWIFIEWSKANDFVQDVNYPTNMVYARMLEVAGRLYHIPKYIDQATQIKNVIRKQSYVNGFFSDNAVRVNGKLIVQPQNQTEVCQYYAFYFGVADDKQYPVLWNTLVQDFGVKRNTTKLYPAIYPANSFVGNYLRLELLAEKGLIQQVLNESKDQFLYMADLTGTLWENTFPGTSCCHGFASHVAHLFYRDVAGVKRIDAIHKKITIQFNEQNLLWCDVSIPIGKDKLTLKWVRHKSTLDYQLTIPKDYTVEIINHSKLQLNKN